MRGDEFGVGPEGAGLRRSSGVSERFAVAGQRFDEEAAVVGHVGLPVAGRAAAAVMASTGQTGSIRQAARGSVSERRTRPVGCVGRRHVLIERPCKARTRIGRAAGQVGTLAEEPHMSFSGARRR